MTESEKRNNQTKAERLSKHRSLTSICQWCVGGHDVVTIVIVELFVARARELVGSVETTLRQISGLTRHSHRELREQEHPWP